MTGCDNSGGIEQTSIFLHPTSGAGGQVERQVRQQCSTMGDRQMDAEMRSRISAYFNQQLEEMNDGSTEVRRIASQMKTLFERNAMRTFA